MRVVANKKGRIEMQLIRALATDRWVKGMHAVVEQAAVVGMRSYRLS